MAGVNVEADVKVYEVDGSPHEGAMDLFLTITSHRLHDDRVIVHVADGTKLTVVARDLRRAIEACSGR